jgi:hypothetical protein
VVASAVLPLPAAGPGAAGAGAAGWCLGAGSVASSDIVLLPLPYLRSDDVQYQRSTRSFRAARHKQVQNVRKGANATGSLK